MLTFVTGNQGKIKEARSILGPLRQYDLDLTEIQELNPRKIIEHKLAEARRRLGNQTPTPKLASDESKQKAAAGKTAKTNLITKTGDSSPKARAETRSTIMNATELIVEDTSLYCAGLKNLPGPLIKWFLQKLGPRGLYELVKSTGNFRATAETMIGYADARGRVRFFSGKIRGKIVAPRGPNSFGWDPIFLPKGHTKTFAQMSSRDKNRISMRKKALKKLHRHLKTAKS